jgi:hypothetical protein
MDAADYGTFETAFKRLSSALRFKPSDKDGELPRTYFRLLMEHPLAAVLDAARACARTRVAFPKPAEWIAAIETPAAPPRVRQMPVDELAERDRAARLRYRDAPCRCADCCQAGVDDLAIRYVPTELLTGEPEVAYDARRQRTEVVGHWAHGEELRRWYEAHAVVIQKAVRFPRLVAVVASREPGEEG